MEKRPEKTSDSFDWNIFHKATLWLNAKSLNTHTQNTHTDTHSPHLHKQAAYVRFSSSAGSRLDCKRVTWSVRPFDLSSPSIPLMFVIFSYFRAKEMRVGAARTQSRRSRTTELTRNTGEAPRASGLIERRLPRSRRYRRIMDIKRV